MANTTPDFDTIWAANSPIGLYPLTTKEILQGWNFVGATPPPRSAFDAWMNRADLKMQWMYNNMFSEDALAGFLYWRLPNTAYFVGEKVALQKEFDIYLECTTAGESSADQMLTLPEEKKVGDALQDGTIQWVVRQKANTANIADSISGHNTDGSAHSDIRQLVTTHNTSESAHPALDFVKTMSAASDGLHFRTRNAQADTVLNLINTLQATLNQGTVPSGNKGTILALLSGIVHQIKALSGKTNWWETPKASFETLSAGIVAGYVSNPNAWWVKLGGTIPLIIQGIMKSTLSGSKPTFVFPVSFGHLLSAQMTKISGTWEHEIIIENYSNTSITWSCRNVNKEDFSDQEPITGFFIGTV